MGLSRRRLVRSDEEEEDIRDPHGDAAGPSNAPRKTRKTSGRQAPSQPKQTAGASQRLKWLKGVARKETDSDSDWEESSDHEEVAPTTTAWRHRWSQKPVEKKTGRTNRKSKDTTMHSISNRNRKQKPSSARRPSCSTAKFGCYEDTCNESTEGWTVDEAHTFLGEEFEQLLFDDTLSASRSTYVKELDLPERFQMLEESLTAAASRDDWTKEAQWIYGQLFQNSEEVIKDEDLNLIAEIDKELLIQEIIFVLMQLHLEKCEVPVIGMYQFQECLHLAGKNEAREIGFDCCGDKLQIKSFKLLWMVFQLDRKWLALLHRKSSQQETWKSRVMNKNISSYAEERSLDVLMQDLQDADSEATVVDLDAKFDFEFSSNGQESFTGQYKRPKRQSFYSTCCKSGLSLSQLVKQLGLTAEQLGENLDSSEKIHEPVNPNVCPEDIDLSHASGQFTVPQSALTGARHMAAYALSCEPRLRKYVRTLFEEHAVVNTRQTSKGKFFIDAFHEFTAIEEIQAKPVKSFHDGQWLLVQKAEEDELVEVQIELTEEVFNGYLTQSLERMYFSNASDKVAELWNEQRKLTLQEALSQMLLPLLAKEMRLSLMVRAKGWVQAECCKSLWKRVSMAPYTMTDPFTGVPTNSKVSADSENAVVLSCCWGSRNPPTTFVMLDAFGEMIDTLQTGYLTICLASQQEQLQRKADDQEMLARFIQKYKPNVVVVGAVSNPACRRLKDAIVESIGKAAEADSALTSVPVVYGDESLASLYEKSQVSLMQLPKQPSIFRRAVGLGRSIQNPLALIAALCNSSKDIVALRMHPLQRFLSADDLYSAIEHVMVTITNQVGVDVNLAVAHEWLFSPLQFVCGLGWNKASRIQQVIKESGWLPNRESLSRYPFSFKDVVFRNSSAFLRICQAGQALSGLRKLDPLDDTRIHPEQYEVARKLAVYSFTGGQTYHGDVDLVEQSVLHIRKNPDALTEETVISFFNSLQIEEEVRLEILKDIRLELLCGFRECRVPYSQPTQDEEFTWLTGEDDTSLCTGKAVNALVQRVFRHRVICTLESGIRGFLEKEDFSSDPNVDLTKVFLEGSFLTCFVANVLKDQLSVQLTYPANKREIYDGDANDLHFKAVLHPEDNHQNFGQFKSKDVFKPRDIQHPLFQNVSISDAIKALSNENPGKVIFHPSNEGPACLSMTLKVQDSVYVQKEVEELEKDNTNIAAFSQLGNSLKIDGKIFTTLDEVVTSYACSLILRINEVLQSRLFQTGNSLEIRNFLERERQVSTDSFVYCFSLCPSNTPTIAISYMVSEDFLREDVNVYSEGYGLHGKMFRKIDTVVNYIRKISNDSGSRWAVQSRGQYKQRGGGTGRGRSGRFGPLLRGQGFRGRGRRNNVAGKQGASGTENCEWNSAGGQAIEHENGVNNWAAEESGGWNEQKTRVEAFTSQDESGWGVMNCSSDKQENGWEQNDLKNSVTTGWEEADGSSDKLEHGWEANNSKNTETAGWGVAHVSSENVENGWEANSFKNNKSTGWGAAGSDRKESKRTNDISDVTGQQAVENDSNKDIGWNEKRDGVEVFKGIKSSGWGEGENESRLGAGVSESCHSGAWGSAYSSCPAQDVDTLNERGHGARRGYAGRFGSGFRGRGPQGRGGRGRSSSSKWEGQDAERTGWSSPRHDRNNNKEQDFNNWGIKDRNVEKEQNASVVGSKHQENFGWGVANDSSEDFKSRRGADDSNNMGTTGWETNIVDKNSQNQNEKQSTTGWCVGEENTATEGTGWNEAKNDNVCGAGNLQLTVKDQARSGWDADDLENTENGGWEAANSSWGGQGNRIDTQKLNATGGQRCERSGGWGTADSDLSEKQNEKVKKDQDGWNVAEENSAAFPEGENPKGTKIGASDAGLLVDKNKTWCGWGGQYERENQEDDRKGWGHRGRFGSGQRGSGFQGRGRGFQGRNGRGNRLQRRWGSQDSGNNDWNSAGSRQNEQKKNEEHQFSKGRGLDIADCLKEKYLNPQTRDDSYGAKESGWGTSDSDTRDKQSKTSWHTVEGNGGTGDGSENRNEAEWGVSNNIQQGCGWKELNVQPDEDKTRCGWGASDTQTRCGWGASDTQKSGWGAGDHRLGKEDKERYKCGSNVQSDKDKTRLEWGADDLNDTKRSGWRAEGCRWGRPDEERDNHGGDRMGHAYVGRFRSGSRGRGFQQGRGGRRDGLPGKWGAQEAESRDWNPPGRDINEHKKQREQGFYNLTSNESTSWGKKANNEVPKCQDDGGLRTDDGPAENFKSGWEEDISENIKHNGWGPVMREGPIKNKPGWNVEQENGASPGNVRNGEEGKNLKEENGWGDGDMQSDKGQSGSGWEVHDSKNMEKSDWEAVNHRWAAEDKEIHKHRNHDTDRCNTFCSEHRERSQESGGREKNFSDQWEVQEMEGIDQKSEHSFLKGNMQHEDQGFGKWGAEESNDQRKPGSKMHSDRREAQEIGNSEWNSAFASLAEHRKDVGSTHENVLDENNANASEYQKDRGCSDGSKRFENEDRGAAVCGQVSQDEERDQQCAIRSGETGQSSGSPLGHICPEGGDTFLSRKSGADEENQQGDSTICVSMQRTKLEKHTSYCSTTEGLNMNAQEANVSLVKCMDSDNRNVEATGDVFWGACEDLMDSNELDGLINQKDALQSEEQEENTLIGVGCLCGGMDDQSKVSESSGLDP